MPASPGLRRRRLAAELRGLRDQSGLSISDVAGKLDWPGLRISRIETRQAGSKDRGGPALAFTPQAWNAFAAAVKHGEFDLV